MAQVSYHHGDLRNVLLEVVGEIIDERGVGAVSLREAARRAGVSHSAPAHHFGDKTGLLTAFAAEGFREFGERMQAAFDEATGEGARAQFRAIGLEYLRFATERRAYFEVMFRSEMHDNADETLREYGDQAFDVLMGTVQAFDAGDLSGADSMHVAIGAWATVHGLATLWLDGALAQFTDEDLLDIAVGIFEANRHT